MIDDQEYVGDDGEGTKSYGGKDQTDIPQNEII
jgi:hypothetical protein